MRHAWGAVLALALIAGVGALTVVWDARAREASASVHRSDRLELQTTLTSLTRQYVLLSFAQLHAAAVQPGWQLTPGSASDRARLKAFVDDPLLGYAAALTDLGGRPLTYVTGTPRASLPSTRDPGYAFLAAGLLAGRPGLSGVMRAGDRHVVAFAVPVDAGGRHVALLVGYADVADWALQRYVSEMQVGPRARGYVVDGAGVAVAGADVGRPVPGLPVSTPARDAEMIRYRLGGADQVATRGAVGYGGWQSVTTQPAAAYAGSSARNRTQVQIALILLLLIAAGAVVIAAAARHAALRRLAEQSLFDPLTGLAQRRLLELHLGAALARARRSGAPLGVLFADLDEFKAVNDTYGHRRGDVLLAEAGRRLRSCLREEDVAARLGGDEFVVVAEGLAGVEELERLANRIVATVARPVALDRGTATVHVSVGGVVVRDGTVEGVLEAADDAMYAAKKARCGSIVHDRRQAPMPPVPTPAPGRPARRPVAS
jgi:diguanylate cyclase (GGDEF)-like protein